MKTEKQQLEPIHNEWISVKQAMQLLQISSRTTLYHYGKKYNIRVTKPLGKTYWNRQDILNKLSVNSITLGL
jgi:predicted site-specific integrase-resolvase